MLACGFIAPYNLFTSSALKYWTNVFLEMHFLIVSETQSSISELVTSFFSDSGTSWAGPDDVNGC